MHWGFIKFTIYIISHSPPFLWHCFGITWWSLRQFKKKKWWHWMWKFWLLSNWDGCLWILESLEFEANGCYYYLMQIPPRKSAASCRFMINFKLWLLICYSCDLFCVLINITFKFLVSNILLLERTKIEN